jgi:hypothetical protein
MRRFSAPVELVTLLYFVCYVPYILLTKWLSSTPYAPLGRPLTGLEVLPASLILSGVFTFAFVWATGWWKAAHTFRLGGLVLPRPTRWTLLSGIGTSLLLFTVPLSFTFQGVSIPFIQLLMRGDVLVIAPLVDLMTGRKVRWYSWVALGLVLVGLGITLKARGGFHLPPLAILTVVLYTIGYFVRLAVMTKVSKSGEPGSVQRYFVEEKIVGIPLAVLAVAAISFAGVGSQAGQLGWGFSAVWTSDQLPQLALIAVFLFLVSVFAAVILLDKRENTFCVPLERSASILAGIAGAYILAVFAGLPYPTGPELTGAILLVAAITVLSVGPHLGRRKLTETGQEAAPAAR